MVDWATAFSTALHEDSPMVAVSMVPSASSTPALCWLMLLDSAPVATDLLLSAGFSAT